MKVYVHMYILTGWWYLGVDTPQGLFVCFVCVFLSTQRELSILAIGQVHRAMYVKVVELVTHTTIPLIFMKFLLGQHSLHSSDEYVRLHSYIQPIIISITH